MSETNSSGRRRRFRRRKSLPIVVETTLIDAAEMDTTVSKDNISKKVVPVGRENIADTFATQNVSVEPTFAKKPLNSSDEQVNLRSTPRKPILPLPARVVDESRRHLLVSLLKKRIFVRNRRNEQREKHAAGGSDETKNSEENDEEKYEKNKRDFDQIQRRNAKNNEEKNNNAENDKQSNDSEQLENDRIEAESQRIYNATQLYKTELCDSYEKHGTCRYGRRCQFAHGFAELRAKQFNPKFKTKKCFNFPNCPYSNRCQFIHEENAEQLSETRSFLSSSTQEAQSSIFFADANNGEDYETELRSLAMQISAIEFDCADTLCDSDEQDDEKESGEVGRRKVGGNDAIDNGAEDGETNDKDIKDSETFYDIASRRQSDIEEMFDLPIFNTALRSLADSFSTVATSSSSASCSISPSASTGTLALTATTSPCSSLSASPLRTINNMQVLSSDGDRLLRSSLSADSAPFVPLKLRAAQNRQH